MSLDQAAMSKIIVKYFVEFMLAIQARELDVCRARTHDTDSESPSQDP